MTHRLCTLAVLVLSLGIRADDWPQWRGPTRDGWWRETGIVSRFSAPQLPAVWRVPIGSGYTSPTVCNGLVYVSDRVTTPAEKERVLCFDARTGERKWSHDYDCVYRRVSFPAGPRAAITVRDGRAYALGTMGHLHCCDARTGDVLWQHDLHTEYRARIPTWGISAAPLIEGDLLIVQIGGRPDACLVAFNRVSGKEVWRALKDRCSYSAPVVIDQAGQRVLACWTGDRVVGLEPETGKLFWEHPFPSPKMVIGVADPIVDSNRLLISDFFDGSLCLQLAEDRLAATKLWRRKGPSEKRTDSLHAMIGTPVLDGDLIYGVDSYGEFRCLRADTGDRVWEDTSLLPKLRWGTIHIVRNADKAWLFTEKGDLVIARLTPTGLQVLSKTHLIDPTRKQHQRGVCWTHPAFANRHVFIRNDQELLCASLAQAEH